MCGVNDCVLCVAQGDWTEEEVERLREVFSEVCEGVEEENERVTAVMVHFPHRGVRDVTRQLREEGLLVQRKRGGGGGGERRKRGDDGEGKKKTSKFILYMGMYCIVTVSISLLFCQLISPPFLLFCSSSSSPYYLSSLIFISPHTHFFPFSSPYLHLLSSRLCSSSLCI